MQTLIFNSHGWLSWALMVEIFFVISSLQGKVFPKLRNRVPQGSGSSDSVSDKEEDEATDYVFRILFPNSQSEFGEIPSREANYMSGAHEHLQIVAFL